MQSFSDIKERLPGKAQELAQGLPVINRQSQDSNLVMRTYKAPRTFCFASLQLKDRWSDLVLELKNNFYAFYTYDFFFYPQRRAKIVHVFSLSFMW